MVNPLSKYKKDNEKLSDLVYQDGWHVVKEMVEVIERDLLDKCLLESDSEWDAILKDGNLKAIHNLRMLVSRVEERAESYRKSKKVN